MPIKQHHNKEDEQGGGKEEKIPSDFLPSKEEREDWKKGKRTQKEMCDLRVIEINDEKETFL